MYTATLLLAGLVPVLAASSFSCIKPVNPIPAGPPGACCEELAQSHLLSFLYTGKNCESLFIPYTTAKTAHSAEDINIY